MMNQHSAPDSGPGADSGVDQEQPFISHLVELRQRLVRMVLAVLVIFIIAFPFANEIYTYLAEPLMRHLPDDTSMIATDVASPFLTPFKLTLVLAIFVSMPFTLYQLWGFIAPGLYQTEKRLVMPLVVSSTILYYLGMAFAYYVVFPLIFGFFVSVAPEGVSVMTDISKYLDFVLKLFFAFGLAFEVPVATVLLVVTGMTTPDKLVQKRPYIIVGVFVIAMLLTPPDVISQTLLALPVWLLFELGVIAARLAIRGRETTDDDDPPPAPAAAGVAAGVGTGVAATAAGHQPYNPDDDDDGWDGVNDEFDDGFDAELDQAIAEQEALDNPDPRDTDHGIDDELDLQSGESPSSAADAGPDQAAGDQAPAQPGDVADESPAQPEQDQPEQVQPEQDQPEHPESAKQPRHGSDRDPP